MKKRIIAFIKLLLGKLGVEIMKKRTLKDWIEMGKYDWMQSLDIKTVIDVGANDGEFAGNISQIYPEAEIYSFEPLLQPYEKLNENLKHLKNFTGFNCALGDIEMESVINHNEFSPSSSLLKITDAHTDAFPHTKNTYQEKIKIKLLDSFKNEIKLVPNVLLKIDVQGYEMSVLRGAVEMLEKVDAVIIETSFVELYHSQPLFNDVYEFLLKAGFVFRGNIDQLPSPYTGEILQADSLFIRNRILK